MTQMAMPPAPQNTTVPDPTPTGLVGPQGYAAWVHLAMWCPQALQRLTETEESVAMHFWRLDRKVRRQVQTVTANLRRRHPGSPLRRLETQAQALVRTEWVTVQTERDAPVWEPGPVMDTETGLWHRWTWPGIDNGKGWANEILVELGDSDLSREEIETALGPEPVRSATLEQMPATKAETGLWQPWENSDFENLIESMRATVISQWDRTMVSWHLAVAMETLQTPDRVRALATAVSRRVLHLPTPPHQPPVVPVPLVEE